MLSEYISSLPKEGKLSREEEARLWGLMHFVRWKVGEKKKVNVL